MNKKCLGLFFASILFTGCVSGPNVTEENALEVAIDDSNNNAADVTASEVTKKDNVYIVVFTTPNGQYTYQVGTDGLVKKRGFSTDITLKQGPDEQTTEPSESKKNEENMEQPKTDDKETAAIDAALNNVGLTQDQTTSISTSLSEDGSQYTVTIVAGDSTTTCVVEVATGNVISTMFN